MSQPEGLAHLGVLESMGTPTPFTSFEAVEANERERTHQAILQGYANASVQTLNQRAGVTWTWLALEPR